MHILAKGRDISEILQNVLQKVIERNKIIMRKHADRLQRSFQHILEHTLNIF